MKIEFRLEEQYALYPMVATIILNGKDAVVQEIKDLIKEKYKDIYKID